MIKKVLKKNETNKRNTSPGAEAKKKEESELMQIVHLREKIEASKKIKPSEATEEELNIAELDSILTDTWQNVPWVVQHAINLINDHCKVATRE